MTLPFEGSLGADAALDFRSKEYYRDLLLRQQELHMVDHPTPGPCTTYILDEIGLEGRFPQRPPGTTIDLDIDHAIPLFGVPEGYVLDTASGIHAGKVVETQPVDLGREIFSDPEEIARVEAGDELPNRISPVDALKKGILLDLETGRYKN